MKSFLSALLLLTISLSTKAQKEILLTDITKHIGDSVSVTGKVFGTKAVSNGKLLLINVGGAFPAQLLTIVLNEEIRKVLAEPLKTTLEQIEVAGKVELYRNKPQIVIHHPSQVQRIITEKPAQ